MIAVQLVEEEILLFSGDHAEGAGTVLEYRDNRIRMQPFGFRKAGEAIEREFDGAGPVGTQPEVIVRVFGQGLDTETSNVLRKGNQLILSGLQVKSAQAR